MQFTIISCLAQKFIYKYAAQRSFELLLLKSYKKKRNLLGFKYHQSWLLSILPGFNLIEFEVMANKTTNV
jgi:hypothetical protein